jgi:molybdopterin synthase sulfur carrier subunit
VANATTHATLTVRVPGLLRSYTEGAATVELPCCATLAETMRALDARYPGIRFRIVDEQDALRPHIKFFVDGTLVRDLDAPMAAARELMIVGALSGG